MNRNWILPDDVWLRLCEDLRPHPAQAPFIRDYLQRNIQMAVTTVSYVAQSETSEARRKAEASLSGIEGCSLKVFGVRDPGKVRDPGSPVAVLEARASLPEHENESDNTVWQRLLIELKAAHREAKKVLEDLDGDTGLKKTSGRDIVINAAMEAYRQCQGKVPHAQKFPDKATKYDRFLHSLVDFFDDVRGAERTNSATIKSAADALRKQKYPNP